MLPPSLVQRPGSGAAEAVGSGAGASCRVMERFHEHSTAGATHGMSLSGRPLGESGNRWRESGNSVHESGKWRIWASKRTSTQEGAARRRKTKPAQAQARGASHLSGGSTPRRGRAVCARAGQAAQMDVHLPSHCSATDQANRCASGNDRRRHRHASATLRWRAATTWQCNRWARNTLRRAANATARPSSASCRTSGCRCGRCARPATRRRAGPPPAAPATGPAATA